MHHQQLRFRNAAELGRVDLAQKTLDLQNQNPNIHVGNLSIVLPKGVCSAFAHRLPPVTPEFNVGKHTLRKKMPDPRDSPHRRCHPTLNSGARGKGHPPTNYT